MATSMESVMGVILAAGKGARMESSLPNVLHKVDGVPMVRRCVDTLQIAGISKIVVVVGYRADLIQKELKDSVLYTVQEKQNGTGHAVACAKSHFEDHDGEVVIVYGDNPLLSSATIRRLVTANKKEGVSGALLSIALENPPVAGRIVRDDSGAFVNVIEQQDCTEDQKKINEINAGTYSFKASSLTKALSMLKSNNAQGEYYLTDVPGILVAQGENIEVVKIDDIFEVLGVNDQHHLKFAESARDIRFAESLYPLVDAVVEMARKQREE